MSCKISRRNFMRCAGIGALALASTGLLGGCTKFDAEYGMNEVVTFTDKKGGSFSMAITQAVEIAAGRHEDMAENYRLNIDETQRYVYLHIEVNNNTGETTPASRSSCTTSATPSTGSRASTPTKRSASTSMSPTRTKSCPTITAPPTPTPTRWSKPRPSSGPTTTACT